jgi:formylglycine-generating enzyme required for sulfatase activity
MKRQGVTLPERRVELYQRYVETLIKHWNLARGLAGRPEKDLDLLDTLRILQPLALWMHETSPGVGLVKEGDLHRELQRIFAERKERDPEKAAHQFLVDVREHTSLLLDRGGRQYGFIHLTFQEYLAAAALAQKGQQEVGPIVSALSSHVGEAPWREVSLLTLGYLALVQQRDQAASAVLGELLQRSPGPAGEAAILAGEAVVDMGRGVITSEIRERIVTALFKTMRSGQQVKPARKAEAGAVLSMIGDPRPEVVTIDGMELCWVPAGSFLMGLKKKGWSGRDEKPQFECSLPYDLWIGRYPVTVAQYVEYEKESGKEPKRWSRRNLNRPMMGVGWYDAVEFCRWLTEKWQTSGKVGAEWEVRLPSEAEWEKAARGGLTIPSRPVIRVAGNLALKGRFRNIVNPNPGRQFPWGARQDIDQLSDDLISTNKFDVVGCAKGGESPYGVEELIGNMSEWTLSLWGKDHVEAFFRYPYKRDDGRENLSASGTVLRVLRGGWISDQNRPVYCTSRDREVPDLSAGIFGFRVVLSPVSL